MPVTTDTEKKPLPWFPFNIKAYVTDTMRLTTEAHGAYLLLMLDYYSTGEAPPDDDDVLAAICKLTPEAWAKHRKVLMPYFKVTRGRWVHERIEAEMLEACQRHAKKSAAQRQIANKRWAKKGENAAPEPQKPVRQSRKAATDMPAALPPASHKDAQEQEHLSKNREGEAPSPAKVLGDVGEEQIPTMPVTITDTLIAPDFRPAQKLIDAAMADCGDMAVIEHELRMFIASMQERGAFSANWDSSWVKWWGRWKAHEAAKIAQANGKPAKAPPRVQVNKQPEPADYEAALMRWMTNESMWSRHLGPEPGMTGCKVPPEIFARHGLDPKTGRKLQPAG